MPACEASHYLQLWDSDAPLKPLGFDAATSLRLRGVADIAAVSTGAPWVGGWCGVACMEPWECGRPGCRRAVQQARLHALLPDLPPDRWTSAAAAAPPIFPPGGRANGRWKPDNQDSFLVQPTASKHGASSSSSDEEAAAGGAGGPAAAAIGVFDGHGRLGGQAAAIVRQAMAERLAALSSEQAAEAAERGLAGAASLLDGCFTAADAALAESGKDFSKSGCTAVLALLDRDRCGWLMWGRGLETGNCLCVAQKLCACNSVLALLDRDRCGRRGAGLLRPGVVCLPLCQPARVL